MEYQLSGIEVKVLVDEFQILKESKIDKIFQPGTGDFIFRLHKASIGKLMFRFVLPGLIYLTDYKEDMDNHPKGFCMLLRKRLSNCRLKEINQIKTERIICFIFETKEEELFLYAELFGKGNLILCNKDNNIIGAAIQRKWKDRTILSNEKYIMPESRNSFFELEKKQIEEIIKENKELNIIKFLAISFGLGGKYAKEICFRAKIDEKAKELNEEEIEKIANTLIDFKKENPKAVIVKENDNIIDISPYKLESHNNKNIEYTESFNIALNSIFSTIKKSEKNVEKIKAFEKKINKIELIINTQKEQIEKFEKEIEIAEKSTEIIYSNYEFISELIKEIDNAKSKYTWEDIKTRVEKHPKILKFDLKDKKLTLEL
jgi:predicted ribosome quality control (RQC) complex YloA/Tae2 family protein